jgi:hypothetical protein
MALLSPWWLWLLIPWAALLLWLMWGRREREWVPFLKLWPRDEGRVEKRRALEPPPLGATLAMLAILLGIIALARPAVRGKAVYGAVVVDRSPRMRERTDPIEQHRAELEQALGRVPSRVVDAADPAALERAVDAMLHETAGVVLVVSDRPIRQETEARVIRIAPAPVRENVTIVRASARATPRPAVMVRLRNESGRSRATVTVGAMREEVELPPRGEERDYVIEPDELRTPLRVEVDAGDAWRVDNVATLERRQAWPQVEAAVAVSPALERMIDVYAQARPPADGSARVQIVDSLADVRADEPAVVLARSAGAEPTTAAVRADDHAIMRDVPLQDLGGLRVTGDPPPQWRAIAWAGERAIVAVRDPANARPPAVWVGFESPEFSSRPGFVIFWTNVFDFTGGGAESFVAEGVFDVRFEPSPDSAWRDKLGQFAHHATQRPVTPWAALGALVALTGAAVAWRRSP